MSANPSPSTPPAERTSASRPDGNPELRIALETAPFNPHKLAAESTIT
jgi:hypothetical protein